MGSIGGRLGGVRGEIRLTESPELGYLSVMKLSASHGPLIGPVAPQEHAEALQLVFSRLAPEDRQRQVETLLKAVSSGEISPQGLLGARRGGRLVGAVF